MITVLRLGHRIGRDHRISTHCGLVARAFGARKMYYTGEQDTGLEASLQNTVRRWGGPFEVEYVKNWKDSLHKQTTVHLTMYGIPFKKKLAALRRRRSLLVIVGGAKVPPEIYRQADYNLAVMSQPHSEVAALAVFLHEYVRGRDARFSHAKLKIVPQERGKKVASRA